MGDRANFGFRTSEGTIFLYGHSAGYQMMQRLADAIAEAEPRWTDPSYATRICVSQLVGNSWSGEYGWGLSLSIGDNEHSVPVVDWDKGIVSLYAREGYGSDPDTDGTPSCSWGLALFCKKYGSTDVRRRFANAKPESQAKPIDTPTEPRYTYDEWVEIVRGRA